MTKRRLAAICAVRVGAAAIVLAVAVAIAELPAAGYRRS